MKKLFIIIPAILIIQVYASAIIIPGSKAGDFAAEDPDGRIINSMSIKRSVVAGFYEDRNSTNKNKKLKDALNSLYRDDNFSGNTGNKNIIMKLAIIDGTPSNYVTRRLWKRKIRAKSLENKIDIYRLGWKYRKGLRDSGW